MKKVIKEKVTEITPLQVKQTDIIGILSGKVKTLAIRYSETCFIERKVSEMNTLAKADRRNHASIQDLIKFNLDLGNDVFLFDSWKEFYLWATEE